MLKTLGYGREADAGPIRPRLRSRSKDAMVIERRACLSCERLVSNAASASSTKLIALRPDS